MDGYGAQASFTRGAPCPCAKQRALRPASCVASLTSKDGRSAVAKRQCGSDVHRGGVTGGVPVDDAASIDVRRNATRDIPCESGPSPVHFNDLCVCVLLSLINSNFFFQSRVGGCALCTSRRHGYVATSLLGTCTFAACLVPGYEYVSPV